MRGGRSDDLLLIIYINKNQISLKAIISFKGVEK